MMYKYKNGIDESVTRIEANTSGVSVGDLVEINLHNRDIVLKVLEKYWVLESTEDKIKIFKFSVESIDGSRNFIITEDEIKKVYKEQKTKTYDLIKALDNEECAEAFFEGFDEGGF